MKIQTIARLIQFQKCFVQLDDPTNSTLPYHYDTYYSSSIIIASYLVRIEPFTQVFLHLQSDHFDRCRSHVL
ncbi:unnamed protein product [Rotaria sp. Silwood1]|nr:unnamed protein product [Rotaria sp. Silwood1]CAF1502935.1 unnamed protein product [Rotaria sp. Silwood1]